MDWVLPNFLYYFVTPVISFRFFSLFSPSKIKWYLSVIYILLWLGILAFGRTFGLAGLTLVFLEILLLGLCGILFLKYKAVEAITISALTISVWYVSSGITQSIGHLIAAHLSGNRILVLKFLDTGISVITIILVTFFFQFIFKTFYKDIKNTYNSALLLLMVPVLFISLAERVVSDAVYGNTVVWDTQKGLVFPLANDIEILLLQVFAYLGVFSALMAYKKMTKSIQREQTIKLLEQQAHEKEIYVQEAKSRYEQTRAFRHDVKNHLVVLGELLKENKVEEASQYLLNLGQVSNDLSFSCQSGNVIVDALLGSKLAATKQKDINIQCNIKIPNSSCVKDIDWCIVLSNAIDNAIKANNFVTSEKRYIYISGKRKGNFYLLHIENSCSEMEQFSTDGIGLSNIKAVVQKYSGTTEIEVSENVFKLNMLFVISQQ